MVCLFSDVDALTLALSGSGINLNSAGIKYAGNIGGVNELTGATLNASKSFPLACRLCTRKLDLECVAS
jgi:hypothetical protein